MSHISYQFHLKPFYFSLQAKEMESKNVLDLSSFLLVEATGDSEVDFDPNLTVTDYAAAAADDDDAESCSCDVLDASCVSDLLDGSCEEVEEYAHVADDKEEEEEEEEDGHVYQSWHGGHEKEKTTNKHKSCVSMDSTNESLNEMEKNRLFWEACLAS